MSKKSTAASEQFHCEDFRRRPTLFDALRMGFNFGPLDTLVDNISFCEDSSDYDEDYYADEDNNNYGVYTAEEYHAFKDKLLTKHFHSSRRKEKEKITQQLAEENEKQKEKAEKKMNKRLVAEQNALKLIEDEEKCKNKAEKKKTKKLRQKERRRLEKLEKENEDENKIKIQENPGSEKTKHADNYNNKHEVKHKNISSPSCDLPCTPLPAQTTDDEDEEDEEELDMSSCFVSNAAAIANRKLEKKAKYENRPAPQSSVIPHEAKEKCSTVPQKQVDEKTEVKSEEALSEDVNDFVKKSHKLAVLGNQYAASGNLAQAVRCFTDAIKHNPKEFKLFGNRSFCYEKMLEYEKALNDAEMALAMNPKWIRGLYRKGKALVGLKRYYEARFIYSDILKVDASCREAAEEMMRVQIMQLMEMGLNQEQSTNALVIHGTVEKALESLSGLLSVQKCKESGTPSSLVTPLALKSAQPYKPLSAPVMPVSQPLELFPVWVGDIAPSITAADLYELFGTVGAVHNVRVLWGKRCAFVNYIRKEDCQKAIDKFHECLVHGASLAVRYPDRIHSHLGGSREATTEPTKSGECYFWRTTGCIKNERCTFLHLPENRGIDKHKVQK